MAYRPPEQGPVALETARLRFTEMQGSEAWQRLIHEVQAEPVPLTAEEQQLTGEDVGRLIAEIRNDETQSLARLAVSNTLAFAHNILGATRDSYRRRGVAMLNEAEDMAQLDSEAAEMAAQEQERKARVLENRILALQWARQELPWEKSDIARLMPGSKDMFYGLAQLLGIAAASGAPTDLIEQIQKQHVTALTLRDKGLLVNHQGISEMVETNTITEYLATSMITDGPRAIEVAQNPIPAAAFRAARQIVIAGTA